MQPPRPSSLPLTGLRPTMGLQERSFLRDAGAQNSAVGSTDETRLQRPPPRPPPIGVTMKSLAAGLSRAFYRFLPESLVVAVFLTVVTFLLAVVVERQNPIDVTRMWGGDPKSTRLNSSHVSSSYAVFCLNEKLAAP